MKSPGSLKRLLIRIGLVAAALVVVLLVAVVARLLYAFHDRHSGYRIELAIDGAKARAAAKPLQVGFGRQKINPRMDDPQRPVWLAGFSNGRAATAIHDDLWAVACVLDDGVTRVGIVALDAIGFFEDDVIEVRNRLSPGWKLDYVTVCSLHNHSTPDLMGIWGSSALKTGVDPLYRKQVIAAAANALSAATTGLRPCAYAIHEIPTPPDGLVADTRLPHVFDSDIRAIHFVDPASGKTLGTITGWANHPETPWGKNTEITADFPGFLRDALEKGIRYDDKTVMPGLGGVHLYLNGAVGGLMTTHPSTTVHDPFLDKDLKEPSHDKSRAVGHILAKKVLEAIAKAPAPSGSAAPISVHARTIELPMDNPMFLAASFLGLMDRGQPRWKTIRSEVACVMVGDASFLCVPGEIYPEIVNGGVVRAPGGDFGIDPVEVPPLRQLMPGKTKFVIGLANDEVGYIIPKSEWDEKPPYLFDSPHHVYGEVNSLGPETAPLLHRELKRVCDESRPAGAAATAASTTTATASASAP